MCFELATLKRLVFKKKVRDMGMMTSLSHVIKLPTHF